MPGAKPTAFADEGSVAAIETLPDGSYLAAYRAPARWDRDDTLFVAGLFTGGGLSAQDVLRMVTATPAELLGVSDRVGSLAAGTVIPRLGVPERRFSIVAHAIEAVPVAAGEGRRVVGTRGEAEVAEPR